MFVTGLQGLTPASPPGTTNTSAGPVTTRDVVHLTCWSVEEALRAYKKHYARNDRDVIDELSIVAKVRYKHFVSDCGHDLKAKVFAGTQAEVTDEYRAKIRDEVKKEMMDQIAKGS